MRNTRSVITFLIILGVLYFAVSFLTNRGNTFTRDEEGYSYEKLEKDAERGKIASMTLRQNAQVPTGQVLIETKKGEQYLLNVTDIGEAEAVARKHKISYQVEQVRDSGGGLVSLLPWAGVLVMFVIMFMMMSRMGGGGSGAQMMNFGKSRAKMQNPSREKVRFDNVAGLEEEKGELEEIVDFLKDPAKYTNMGARIPKGVLLVGPPGTGKPLLARAISGEAGVPFFSISGSDFVEMFVGVGASRVRDLFEQAKENAPCIVFIDEIDAVARRRGSGLGGGHDEREQTLNQLLVEMDGFGTNSGIIIMAATNRVDILDPAILRPGRFDRKIAVGRPDVKGREEILKVHSVDKKLSSDVDLSQIARTTPGFSGADLENLMNESAILAAGRNADYIEQEDIKKAFIKVGIGTEKKSRLIPEKERKITAYHESGHAILFHLLPDVGPVYTVSIIPTGIGAAGYTMPLPENDNVFETRNMMIHQIMASMGGRIAEELIFQDITTGASADIKQVTEMARAMITKYGMSKDLGFLNYEESSDEVFIGRDLGHSRNYSEDVAARIDQEVKRLVDDCYAKAKKVLEENMDVLHSCAALLLEKERINRQEFEALFVAEEESDVSDVQNAQKN